MASPNHTLPSPDISDVMNLLSTMKKQNDEAMKEILTKLTRIEDDNRKLRQELLELKSYQKLNNNNVKVQSKKRDEPEYEDVADHPKEPSSNKKTRVSVASSPQLDPPASFNTLDDDCLGNVLDFVGKKCYSVFGRVNKRCHEMFCSKGLPKETYLYGYGPLRLIQQQRERKWNYNEKISKGVLHYNRRDILNWMLTDESEDGCWRLKSLCSNAVRESRLDILRDVFYRANERQLEYVRDCDNVSNLCETAASYGKLECLNWLRENECEWNHWTWFYAKQNGYEHILEYLQNNGYPTEWQVDSESESEDNSDY